MTIASILADLESQEVRTVMVDGIECEWRPASRCGGRVEVDPTIPAHAGYVSAGIAAQLACTPVGHQVSLPVNEMADGSYRWVNPEIAARELSPKRAPRKSVRHHDSRDSMRKFYNDIQRAGLESYIEIGN